MLDVTQRTIASRRNAALPDPSVLVDRLIGHARIYQHLRKAHIREAGYISKLRSILKDVPAAELVAQAAAAPIASVQIAIRRSLLQEQRIIKKDARALPVYAWVKGIKGAGPVNLGLIVGCAGDLSRFPNPAKLWKWFGLGFLPTGERQRRFRDATLAVTASYDPERRAILHVLGECLVRSNDGEFRQLYSTRKQYELDRAPEMTKMHAHRRALRYIEKRFLRDLWRQWNAAV